MGLRTYILRRIIQFIPLIFIVSIITYGIIRSAPGDPVRNIFGMLAGRDYDPADIERLRQSLGLNDPIYIQYLRWLADFLQGNLGYSYKLHEPVGPMIAWRLGNTFKLQLSALALSLTSAVIIGVISAVKQYSKTDKVAMMGALFLWSMPGFWYALMMMLIFSLYLGWFPTHGIITMGAPYSVLDEIWHFILPVIVLGTSMIGYSSRLVRSVMLEVLKQDYILTARSKGLTEKIVIYKHAMRNAMLPVVTMVGLYFSWIFSGAAVIETVFAIPGIGSLMVESSYFRDYSVIMGITMTVTVTTIISLLITDIIYSVLDPRIRY